MVAHDATDARWLRERLAEAGADGAAVEHRASMEDAERLLAERQVDLIVLDLGLPSAPGLAGVQRVRAAAPRIPLVVLAGLDDEPLAVRALEHGALDYLIRGQLETRGLRRALGSAIQRQALEQRIADSEEEYRILFDSNPHAMWVFDAETLAFLAVNDAAVRLYGFSREEFLGMTIKEIRPPEELPALLAHLAEMPDTPGLVATQVRHHRKDGSRIEVAGVTTPIEFRGRRARLVLANDVSERRQLEAQLLQAQKLEAVGRLAGGVAHDFNNLLGVIIGYSELLLKELGPRTSASGRVEQIQRAAEQAAALTRQLLAFGRKQLLQARILDLDQVVEEVETMMRGVLGDQVVMVAIRGAALGRICADPGQVRQVLMNLVVNARDAMPAGGQLILETGNVTLDPAYARAHPGVQPGEFVMMAVSDTGIGMDAQTMSHIFEPFFTTKAAGKGTGLGLPTVIGIVEQSGGTVSVESVPDRGSTFRVYFPRVEDEPAAAAVVELAAGGESGTILVVEDGDSLRVMIGEILESAGHTVLQFADPEEALRMISGAAAAVPLILTDVVMPQMSGPELARAVRRVRPEIQVLFMSGYTAETMGLDGVLDADTQFIQKPFTADNLLRKVRAALDRAQGVRSIVA